MPKPPFKLVNCPHCQALADAHVARCWLCGERVAEPSAVPWARPVAADRDAGRVIEQSNLAITVVVAAVVIGALLIVPGLGILLCILAVPALWRRSRFEESWLRSILAGVATAVLVFVSIVGALFVVCVGGIFILSGGFNQ
jgi:hypothetical protein